MWEINEQGLPGTGKVSVEQMGELLQLSDLCIGAYIDETLVGFVLCLYPKKDYSSQNYAWFNERYNQFIYVDRIAISTQHRNKKIGTELYEKVLELATKKQIPITAEVSLRPPNEGSDRFHLRHGFSSVGEFHQSGKSVTMYIRE
jgi:hypothetical protein